MQICELFNVWKVPALSAREDPLEKAETPLVKDNKCSAVVLLLLLQLVETILY